MSEQKQRPLAQNRRVRHDFHIEETFEAGLELKGTEIKSIRAGQISLQDGYVSINRGEAWLKNVHINPYEQGNIFNHHPTRDRKLLLHKRQINFLAREVQQHQMTIVPLRVNLVRGRAKVLIGLARSKNHRDRRHEMRERDMKREAARALKNY